MAKESKTESFPFPSEKFTGMARSVETCNNQGFKNFRILTMQITNGVVTKVKRSDPYANFEAIARLELWNELDIHHLNNIWADGITLRERPGKLISELIPFASEQSK